MTQTDKAPGGDVLDAAADYLRQQYGASFGLDNPSDRTRILERLAQPAQQSEAEPCASPAIAAQHDEDRFYAIKGEIERAMMDERDGKPCGCIIAAGCEARGYDDPEYAANGFIWQAAEAVSRLCAAQQSSSPSPLPTGDGLEPCPFCGGAAECIYVTGMDSTMRAGCRRCGVGVEYRCKPFDQPARDAAGAKAIAAWNTRQSAADALEAAKNTGLMLAGQLQASRTMVARAEAEAADLRKALERAAECLRGIPKPTYVDGNPTYFPSDDVPEDIFVALSHIDAALAAHAKQTEPGA